MKTKEVKLILNDKGEFSIQGNVGSFEALGMVEHAKNVILKDLGNPKKEDVFKPEAPEPLTTAEVMAQHGLDAGQNNEPTDEAGN